MYKHPNATDINVHISASLSFNWKSKMFNGNGDMSLRRGQHTRRYVLKQIATGTSCSTSPNRKPPGKKIRALGTRPEFSLLSITICIICSATRLFVSHYCKFYILILWYSKSY